VHILSRVYNCTESKKLLTSSFGKKFHLPKFLTTIFSYSPEFSHFSSTEISDATFFIIRNFSFSALFSTLTQSYNYNCIIHLLQLQMTFYNCRNCDPLHVKICSGLNSRPNLVLDSVEAFSTVTNKCSIV